MTKFNVGDKVRLTGSGWGLGYTTDKIGGVGIVSEMSNDGLAGFLKSGYLFSVGGIFSVELEEAFDPKRDALDKAFEAVGTPIEHDDIRKGDVYAKQYESGYFSVFTTRGAAENGYEYRLIYRPEPAKIEAPTNLGAVVRYGGIILTRSWSGFFSQKGVPHSDESVSRYLTNGTATILFEGVDDE